MNLDLMQALLFFVPTVLSLTVHEWAHAASANALGDDTAEREGRMTLNPLAHLDPIGTVLVPAIQILTTGGVLFAWAKPVPVNPARFRRTISMSMGSVIVSAAGPVSNLLLALGAAIGLGLGGARVDSTPGAAAFLGAMFLINIGLAVFNLLPVPPLDGSKVLHGLLPSRAAMAYERIFPYAPFLLMGVIMFGSPLLRVPMSLIAGLFLRIGAVFAG